MKRLIVVLAGAALLAAPAVAQDTNTLKAIGQGRALYLVNCAGCHGADVKGATAGTNGGIPDLKYLAFVQQQPSAWSPNSFRRTMTRCDSV